MWTRTEQAAASKRSTAAILAAVAGGACLALGALFLGAWFWDASSVAFASPRMKTNTALGLVLLGAALTARSVAVLRSRAPAARGASEPMQGLARGLDRVAVALSLFALALALATGAQYLGGIDLGLDELLARDPDPRHESPGHPNRMAPNAALAIGGLAIALLAGRVRRLGALSQVVACVALAIGTLALLGYVYEVVELYRPTAFIRISPFSATAVVLGSLGALALRPDVGLSRLAASSGAAGFLTRTMLLVTFALPVLLGWLALEGERRGLFAANVGISLFVLATITTLATVVVALARSIEANEAQRRVAEDRLVRAVALIEELARAATLDEVASATLGAGLPALGATSGALLLTIPEEPALRIVGTRGFASTVTSEYASVPLASPFPASVAARSLAPVFVRSRRDMMERYGVPGAHIGDHRAWAALPLIGRSRLLGVLALSFRDAQPFDDPARSELQRLGSQCAQALERALALQESERATHEAQHASRAKDEFLAMLGHELRNPLAPIRTALELMELRGADALRKERSVIERQVDHMVRLVDDLLDVSRITRGGVELRRRPLDLATVVAKAMEIAGPLFEEKAHRVEIDIPAGLPLDADEHRMTQVITNLLTNAAKYTNARGTIALSARLVGDEVVLAVADDGVGIAPELLPRLFDLFVQGERTIERSEGGLGLGLAIVRSLVEMHGGTIRAESAGKDRGATFTLRLPRGSQAAPRAATSRSGTRLTQQSITRRVLVVDDNRDAAELLGEALAAAGHAVEVAFDGPGAIEVAGRLRPEVAFLDIGLPVMDGYEVARRLRELEATRDAKLVAVTGYGLESDRALAAAAGFDHHLVKPIDLDTALTLAVGPRGEREPGSGSSHVG